MTDNAIFSIRFWIPLIIGAFRVWINFIGLVWIIPALRPFVSLYCFKYPWLLHRSLPFTMYYTNYTQYIHGTVDTILWGR